MKIDKELLTIELLAVTYSLCSAHQKFDHKCNLCLKTGNLEIRDVLQILGRLT